ncbi:dipeptidyl peptidase 4 [Cyprinodon tularosa]|uniref:dipeptidyl peptidase 4 n=1 Tax=Cyprinodon tularosa TaxID=77115 RepID=UPI0018E1FCF2|nr:dipeptidyl peptidase 4 [Cyprinodon tularosa]XP_038157925.1 dipeptidyl peptidase 4 [Cyprinodon tularosa]
MVSVSKVLLGVLGVAVVVILIAVPTVIFLKEDEASITKTFTLTDVFNSSLRPAFYNMKWISDSEYLHRESDDSVSLYDVKTSDVKEFLNRDLFIARHAYDYMLSADRRYVAFMSNYNKVWRHSFTASYSLYDRDSNKDVSPADIPDIVQYFAWAPTGNKLAYVWDNNVYLKTSPESPRQQLTTNGEPNKILNGIPDWVYEEEMFSSNAGFWWSPGGKYLAYAEFNDTPVHNIEYSFYGDGQYPSTISIPYPKPGTPNPVVKLFVVDTDNTTIITGVVVPAAFKTIDHYLATVTWVTDTRIAVQWLKRLQNHLILQIYDFSGSAWNPVEDLELTSTGWIGRFSPSEPVFAPDGNSYYLIMSDSAKYKHIHHVDKGEATAITSGNWEAIDILKVTADSVYYSSNEKDNKPGGRNVYVWSNQGSRCLTCSLLSDCEYNSAYLSHNASYYRFSCSGPRIPYYSLIDTKSNKPMKTLEENKAFEGEISQLSMPTVRRGTIKLNNYNLWYQMYLPPDFDESERYPLLIDVYAGPCSQKVDMRYRVGWSTYLASTQKVIVASFDGRGSGYQGDQLMHEIYQRLGTYEVEDQIRATKEFIKMGFIDETRIAIWGWSYGGYVSSMVLGSGSGVFKCGMAVAPVSKWEYYDSIYTERYMRQPSENRDAYDNSTVTARAKNFQSVQYLLVHGTADDNVHFQQAAEISEALVEEQVDFEAMWYTDKDHGLGGSANMHVYNHMSKFLNTCFE